MKRSVFLLMTILLTICIPTKGFSTVYAQVNESELQEYLTTIHLTSADLEEYLQFYDMTVADFSTVAELQDFLGEPISEQNLKELLTKYDLSPDELEALLLEYGETLEDYTFIDDLDLDIAFFLNHDEEFTIVNDFLSLFGLTEAELENLFEHFSRLDEDLLQVKLQEVTLALQALGDLSDVEQLTPSQTEQLLAIWPDLLNALELDVKFYLVDDNDEKTEMTIQELLARETFDGFSLEMSLYNFEGETVATLIFSDEMLESRIFLDATTEMVEIVDLAEDYRSLLLAQRLPVTATNYGTLMFIGLVVLLAGVSLFFTNKRRVEG